MYNARAIYIRWILLFCVLNGHGSFVLDMHCLTRISMIKWFESLVPLKLKMQTENIESVKVTHEFDFEMVSHVHLALVASVFSFVIHNCLLCLQESAALHNSCLDSISRYPGYWKHSESGQCCECINFNSQCCSLLLLLCHGIWANS